MPRPDTHDADGALEPVARRLGELPHPVRTRILLELAGDVEELMAELTGRGVPREEAALRATERVVPRDEVLDALVRLHRPLYRRLMAPLPDRALRRWERGTLLVVTLGIMAMGILHLARRGFLDGPSPFLWAVLALAGGVAAVILAKGFQLFVRRDHRSDHLDRGLGALLALSGAVVLVAGAGMVTDLWGLAATLEAGVPDQGPLVMAWLRREFVLLATALLTATGGGLAWFLLAQRVAAIRGGDQEVRRTLAVPPRTDTPHDARPSTSPLAFTEAET